MKKEFLNHCILLVIYKDKTDLITPVQVTSEFCEANDEQLQMFDRFSNSDYIVYKSSYMVLVVYGIWSIWYWLSAFNKCHKELHNRYCGGPRYGCGM